MNKIFDVLNGSLKYIVYGAAISGIFTWAWNTFLVATFGIPILTFFVAWAMLTMIIIPFAAIFINMELSKYENLPPLARTVSLATYVIFVGFQLFILSLFI